MRKRLTLGLFLAGVLLYITFLAWLGTFPRTPDWGFGYFVGYVLGAMIGAGCALSSMASALRSSEERGFKRGLSFMNRLGPPPSKDQPDWTVNIK